MFLLPGERQRPAGEGLVRTGLPVFSKASSRVRCTSGMPRSVRLELTAHSEDSPRAATITSAPEATFKPSNSFLSVRLSRFSERPNRVAFLVGCITDEVATFGVMFTRLAVISFNPSYRGIVVQACGNTQVPGMLLRVLPRGR